MRAMYEIGADMEKIMELVADPETNWETIGDTVEMIEGEFLEKADAYGKVLKNAANRVEGLDAEIKDMRKEIERLTARKSAIENNMRRLKGTLLKVMEATGQQRVKTDMFTFFRTTTKEAVIDDFDAIPEKYIKIEKSAKKGDIKRFIDDNGPVPWAHIQENTSLGLR